MIFTFASGTTVSIFCIIVQVNGYGALFVMNKLNKVILAAVVALFVTTTANATTILKLNFGSTGPDFQYAGGILSTIDDGDAATAGDQNTQAAFEGLLAGVPDITTDIASVTFDGITADGAATILPGFVVQNTIGGTFDLWDSSNTLLLSATIDSGSISGPLGAAATGSFVTLSLGNYTGGTLLPLLGGANAASIGVSFTDVASRSGAGFSVNGTSLNAFTADATANLAAVPEPTTVGLLLAGLAGGFGVRRKKNA